MVEIGLHGLSRVHADGTRALASLDLQVHSGELMALAGPTGSGKTTTLRLIAGLDSPSAGSVSMDGRTMNGIPTRDRDLALVTQHDSLYPHLDVKGNLGFALRARRMKAAEVDQRIRAESRVLGIHGLLQRYPHHLSAGHRQKAALGRATARLPRVLLLDEPLGRLPPNERARLRVELRRVHDGLGTTTVYVTHDQAEAMALGDRIALLDHGELQQVGAPLELYHRPRNLFVATFLGTPPMGTVMGRIRVDDGLTWFDVGTSHLRLAGRQDRDLRRYDGKRLVAGLRAERLFPSPHVYGPDHRLRLVVRRVERLGASTLVTGCVPGGPAPTSPQDGSGLVTVRAEAFHPAAQGDVVDVGVDVCALSFFEPITGKAVLHGSVAS